MKYKITKNNKRELQHNNKINTNEVQHSNEPIKMNYNKTKQITKIKNMHWLQFYMLRATQISEFCPPYFILTECHILIPAKPDFTQYDFLEPEKTKTETKQQKRSRPANKKHTKLHTETHTNTITDKHTQTYT